MAIDLNEDPPPSDEDGALACPVWGQHHHHQSDAHVGAHAWGQQQHRQEDGHDIPLQGEQNQQGWFDLNTTHVEDYLSDEANDVDGFIGPAETASFDLGMNYYELLSDEDNPVDGFIGPAEPAGFDLNMDYYELESDDDADVYAEDFHVHFGEGNLQGSSIHAHDQQRSSVHANDLQGSHHGNISVLRKRMNLTDKQVQTIYEELLFRSIRGKLKKTTTRDVATLFNVNRCYVQSIWRKHKKCRAAGVPVNVYSKRKEACGRHKTEIDLSKILTIPFNKRTTLKALTEELECKKTTLHRLLKEGKIRRHSNTLRPCLRDDNKKHRLQHCLSMLDGETVQHQPKFIAMKNIIHIDEKWFNTTSKVRKYYMLPEEEDPLRTIQNTHSIPKCMLLCAVSSPKYDSEGTCYFNGKIGIWPFVRKEPAQRASRNRARGTLMTKPINVTREVSRSYLITKVLPAIVACWPHEHRRETIWIQQDNARTHIESNDQVFCDAVAQTGLDIRIFNQPPNSPDLNVLDLGFFASLQAKTFLTTSTDMDHLILNVQNEFNNYDPSLLRKDFLTLQGCMKEIMKGAGGNRYNIPHMNKDALEMHGTLPTALDVGPELFQSVLQMLAE